MIGKPVVRTSRQYLRSLKSSTFMFVPPGAIYPSLYHGRSFIDNRVFVVYDCC